MASNVSDNYQTDTLTLFTACSDPTTPINLQRASDHSLDGNTNVSATKFQPDNYVDIDWKRLLGYYLLYLILGRRHRATWKHRYDIKYSKTGKRY